LPNTLLTQNRLGRLGLMARPRPASALLLAKSNPDRIGRAGSSLLVLVIDPSH